MQAIDEPRRFNKVEVIGEGIPSYIHFKHGVVEIGLNGWVMNWTPEAYESVKNEVLIHHRDIPDLHIDSTAKLQILVALLILEGQVERCIPLSNQIILDPGNKEIGLIFPSLDLQHTFKDSPLVAKGLLYQLVLGDISLVFRPFNVKVVEKSFKRTDFYKEYLKECKRIIQCGGGQCRFCSGTGKVYQDDLGMEINCIWCSGKGLSR